MTTKRPYGPSNADERPEGDGHKVLQVVNPLFRKLDVQSPEHLVKDSADYARRKIAELRKRLMRPRFSDILKGIRPKANLGLSGKFLAKSGNSAETDPSEIRDAVRVKREE